MIEEKAFSICFNKVDELYQKKILSTIQNLKFLATPEVKEFTEFMFVKKKVNVMKLINSHPLFKDFAMGLQKQIMDKRKSTRKPAKPQEYAEDLG